MYHCPEENQPDLEKCLLRAESRKRVLVLLLFCVVYLLVFLCNIGKSSIILSFFFKQSMHFSGDLFIFFNIIEKYSSQIYGLPEYLSVMILRYPKYLRSKINFFLNFLIIGTS